MALLQRSELLKTVEGIPGTQASPTWAGSDATDVLDLNFTQQRTVNPRQAARPSLSRTVETIGRSSAQVSFSADAKGSGTALTAPDYGEFLEACLMSEQFVVVLALASAATLYVGDLLTGGTSGATGIVMRTVSATAAVPIFPLSGTFGNSEALTSAYGSTVPNTDTTALPGTNTALCWRPWSQPALTFATTSTWSGSDPSVGETIIATNSTSGLMEGGGTILAVNTTTTTVEWNWGTLTASSTLVSTSGKTATVHGTPAITQTEGKSLTMRPNRDGLARPVYGAKGTFALQGEAGAQSRFNFTFTGKAGTPTDIGLQTGASFATTVPPRLASGLVMIDGIAVPVKSFQVDLNNTVVMRANANSAEGDLRAEITGREPTLTLEVDQIGKGNYDFWTKWLNSTTARIGIQLGSTNGNIIAVVAGAAQITEISDGDVDGVATHTISYALRATTADGDDELFIGHG